ncbi:MAG: dethiobiotin synthase [Alphaproteobacteria bacterium]
MMRQSMHGVFVTGTDTDVGKTVAAAGLVWALGADYWKPVQTGTPIQKEDDTGQIPGTDAAEVVRLTALPPDRVHLSSYVLKDPLSPHQAAEREGVRIRLEDIVAPETTNPVVVEGAGGVLVPLNDRHLMIDLMEKLGLPVVVVARTALGTINHTLLTLNALRGRGLFVAGVILNGPPNPANRQAIETYGQIRVLTEIPLLVPFDSLSAATVGARLRRNAPAYW